MIPQTGRDRPTSDTFQTIRSASPSVAAIQQQDLTETALGFQFRLPLREPWLECGEAERLVKLKPSKFLPGLVEFGWALTVFRHGGE